MITRENERAGREDEEIPLVEVPCPLCHSPRYSVIEQARDYVYEIPGTFRFVRCGDCRHLYLNPRPPEDELMRCYPATYAPHRRRAPAGGTLRSGDSSTTGRKSRLRELLARVPFLKRFLRWLGQQYGTVLWSPPREKRRARLLEVGCAHGGYLAEAAAAGWAVDGIEPSEVAAEQARERGFEVRATTLTDAQIESESREAVVAWMVLEHVPDPLEFVREAHRILADGGRLAVSVPNGGGLERRIFGRFWLGYDAPRHLQVFTARRLHRLLTDTGFVQVHTIHQASIRYWWGSVAAWGMERFPQAKWPRRWMACFIGEPPAWVDWLSLIPAKLVSVLRCSGRITVVSVKPAASSTRHAP